MMALPSHNRTAFLDAVGNPLVIRTTSIPSPGAEEVIIQSKALAINPVDYKMQDTGALITKFPFVLGRDISGVIVAAGHNVKLFQAGDRVLARSQSLVSQRTEEGCFQEFVLVPQSSVSPVPARISFEEAAVLPLAVATASAALFTPTGLELSLPVHQPRSLGKVLLVWGGASSVGSMGIQLAAAAGYEVYTTCSRKNFPLVESLGAKKAFDYSSANIFETLVAELKDAMEVVGVYDSIGDAETQIQVCQIMAQLGGGKVVTVVSTIEDVPASVTLTNVMAGAIFAPPSEHVGKAIYHEFLPQALERGQIKPKPDPEVIGTGLGALNAAVDKMRKGVSAKKLIVTIE